MSSRRKSTSSATYIFGLVCLSGLVSLLGVTAFWGTKPLFSELGGMASPLLFANNVFPWGNGVEVPEVSRVPMFIIFDWVLPFPISRNWDWVVIPIFTTASMILLSKVGKEANKAHALRNGVLYGFFLGLGYSLFLNNHHSIFGAWVWGTIAGGVLFMFTTLIYLQDLLSPPDPQYKMRNNRLVFVGGLLGTLVPVGLINGLAYTLAMLPFSVFSIGLTLILILRLEEEDKDGVVEVERQALTR